MINARELKGRWLIGLKDGTKFGNIRSAYLTADGLKLAGVVVATTGILRRTPWIVPVEKVELFGTDVWLADDQNAAVELDSFDPKKELIPVSDLRGRQIVSLENSMLGIILDVLFDSSMKVTGFRVGKVDKEGPLAKSKAITRGSVTSMGSKDTPMVVDLNKAVLPIKKE